MNSNTCKHQQTELTPETARIKVIQAGRRIAVLERAIELGTHTRDALAPKLGALVAAQAAAKAFLAVRGEFAI